MTKRRAVFQYMLDNDWIDGTKARDMFGAQRLGVIIYDLRQWGVEVTTYMLEGTDRYNNYSRWGRYRITDKDAAREIFRKHYRVCAAK